MGLKIPNRSTLISYGVACLATYIFCLFIGWMNQDWVQESILAWLWHRLHLVLDEIWTHDPRFLSRVCYPQDQTFARHITLSDDDIYKLVFLAYLLASCLRQIHNILTNIQRCLSEPVEPNSRNNFRTSGSPDVLCMINLLFFASYYFVFCFNFAFLTTLYFISSTMAAIHLLCRA